MLFVLYDENTNRTYDFSIKDLEPNDWANWHDVSGFQEVFKEVDAQYGGLFSCISSPTAIKYASFYFTTREWRGIEKSFKQYFRARGYKVI